MKKYLINVEEVPEEIEAKNLSEAIEIATSYVAVMEKRKLI